MSLHKNIIGDDVHILHTWTYADQTARLAATGFAAADVGKAAYQQDSRTWWLLTNHSPIAWVDITAGGSSGNDEKVKVSGDDTVADYLAGKLTAVAPVTLTEINPGGDEDLQIGLGAIQHADLGGVTSDQHHAQEHAIDGVDHTGLLAHSALSGITASDHHAHGNKAEIDLVTDGDHDVRTDNPHTVTAAQAGAASSPHAIDGAEHTGALDHGGLSGLADDDHAQYLPTSGARAMGGDLALGDHALTGVKQAQFQTEVNNGDSGAAKTIDWTAGNKQRITLTAVCILTFTAPGGPANLMFKFVQDATGGRTVTWPVAVLWPGGTAPTLSTGAGAVDLVALYYDGTSYYGVASLAFA